LQLHWQRVLGDKKCFALKLGIISCNIAIFRGVLGEQFCAVKHFSKTFKIFQNVPTGELILEKGLVRK
jgi:hypothetical protein